jgi:hypothetical protein
MSSSGIPGTSLPALDFIDNRRPNQLTWHSAFFHFAFRPAHTTLRLSRRKCSATPSVASTPEGDVWHHDVLAYLGIINTGFAALAALRLYGLVKSTTASEDEGSGAMNLDVLALRVLRYYEIHYSPAPETLCHNSRGMPHGSL